MDQILERKRRLSFAIFVSILMVSISRRRTLPETEKQAAFVGESNRRYLNRICPRTTPVRAALMTVL